MPAAVRAGDEARQREIGSSRDDQDDILLFVVQRSPLGLELDERAGRLRAAAGWRRLSHEEEVRGSSPRAAAARRGTEQHGAGQDGGAET